MPCKLADFAEHGDAEAFEAYYGLECVNCGSCSYQCPAKRPLAAEINMMRQTVLANKKKAAAAARAKAAAQAKA
jgi:electron transport complex protein RnfC